MIIIIRALSREEIIERERERGQIKKEKAEKREKRKKEEKEEKK